MIETIQFCVEGDPKGQPRPRAFAFHGKARVYDPGTAEGWKSQVALAAKPVVPVVPLTGPCCVGMHFVFHRPKNHFRKDVLRPDAPHFHVGKPDADNLAKAVADAMTALGFWRDDSQIAELSVTKRYATGTLKAGCLVVLHPLT